MKLSIIDYFLVGLLVLAVYNDITRKKIPNKITMPAILIGIIWSTLNSGLNGFLFSIFGFLFGLTVFLIPYIAGGIGAGDVKLLATIGAIKGWRFTLFSSLSTAAVGGVLVIVYMIYTGRLKTMLINTLGLLMKPLFKLILKISNNHIIFIGYQYFENYKGNKEDTYIPYALAIAIGTIAVLLGAFDGIIKI